MVRSVFWVLGAGGWIRKEVTDKIVKLLWIVYEAKDVEPNCIRLEIDLAESVKENQPPPPDGTVRVLLLSKEENLLLPRTENPSEICSFPDEMFSYLKFYPVKPQHSWEQQSCYFTGWTPTQSFFPTEQAGQASHFTP